jgi:hypothetical protein
MASREAEGVMEASGRWRLEAKGVARACYVGTLKSVNGMASRVPKSCDGKESNSSKAFHTLVRCMAMAC